MQYLSVSNKQIVQLQLKKIKIKKKYYVTNTHPLEKFKKYMQKKKKRKPSSINTHILLLLPFRGTESAYRCGWCNLLSVFFREPHPYFALWMAPQSIEYHF